MITLSITPKDSIQEILNGYDLNETIELKLSAGVYKQKLHLAHNHLKLIGQSPETTKIVYDDYSYKMHQDGLLYNTFRTSTVTVTGDHVKLENLTIENSSGHGFTIGQAVALSLYGDNSLIDNCYLIGCQDTLFLGPLPVDLTIRYDHFLPKSYLHTRTLYHHIKDTYIEGDVDYVFGSGIGLFENCQFVTKHDGYVFAPSTYESFPYGMIVINSKFNSLATNVYIARPWRTFGKVAIINSSFEGIYHPLRYDAWDKPHFSFYEFPYIPSKLSKSLRAEEIEQLNTFIKNHFNYSIKN